MHDFAADFQIMDSDEAACCMCGEPIQEWDLYMILPLGNGTLRFQEWNIHMILLEYACESCADLAYEFTKSGS